VSGFLLDVNVLIALLWPDHEFHGRAQRWFHQNANQGWATCAMTQAAFVRVVSNPTFSHHTVSTEDTVEVLHGSLRHPAHRFWTEDIGLAEALSYLDRSLVGHQQITDAYLLGLTIHKKGRLATLDRGLASLIAKPNDAIVTLI
jgi:uncharacterized protein